MLICFVGLWIIGKGTWNWIHKGYSSSETRRSLFAWRLGRCSWWFWSKVDLSFFNIVFIMINVETGEKKRRVVLH